MRKFKRTLAWMLAATMLCGSFMPGQQVEASLQLGEERIIENNTEAGVALTIGNGTQAGAEGTTENSTQAGTEGTTENSTQAGTEGTTENSTQAGTEGATENNTQASTEGATENSTQPGVENTTATTENTNTSTTTETPTEPKQDVVNPDYIVSELSPLTSKIIVLDPGHCGTHPGASGNGLREEVVVLDIAKACKDALAGYGDVTVYMTRETGSCCQDLELGDCLISRNNYAKKLDADFLVSMHINAGGTNGANVLAAYKSGYHDNIRVETQDFGKIALQKLQALGIANRGLLLRKSGSGNRYSNGKLADYYSIVRNGVLQNIPSVIIEHGYISSSSDCTQYFKTAAKRKKVGQADAKAIISYYGLKKLTTAGKFQEIDGATYYITAKGKKVTGWVKDDEKWYYFDKTTAKMQTGFLNVDGEQIYLSPSTGEMLVGWFVLNGSTYLAKGNGALVRGEAYSDGVYNYLFNTDGAQLKKKGLHTVDGATYYVDKKGHVATGVVKYKGKYYGFDSETYQRVTGYQKLSGKYYYFDEETGAAAIKQIVNVDGKSYYFGSKGVRQTGWVKYKGSKYYFNTSSGAMVKGWKKISGRYYYFSKTNGKMQKNKWIGKYYVNSKGIRTKKR